MKNDRNQTADLTEAELRAEELSDLNLCAALGILLEAASLSGAQLQKRLHIGYGAACKLLGTLQRLGAATESGGKYTATESAGEILRELPAASREPAVYLLLADGFEEVEALAALDILRRGGVEVKTVGITGRTVTGAHGISVRADIVPAAAGAPIKMLILPGGMPGTTNLDTSAETERLIGETLSGGGRIAAICAAPSILGRRGLLRGREAVCYPGFEGLLDGAILATKRVVTSDCYTTAVGMGAACEFGLELLSLLTDGETAERVARSAFIPC